MTQQSLFNPPERRTAGAIRAHLRACGFSALDVEDFLDYHRANKHIFEQYEKEALRLIYSGESQISSMPLLYSVRNNHKIAIKNATASYYSRVFAFLYPQFAERFVFNKVKNREREAA